MTAFYRLKAEKDLVTGWVFCSGSFLAAFILLSAASFAPPIEAG